jgi:hypothetical protein
VSKQSQTIQEKENTIQEQQKTIEDLKRGLIPPVPKFAPKLLAAIMLVATVITLL